MTEIFEDDDSEKRRKSNERMRRAREQNNKIKEEKENHAQDISSFKGNSPSIRENQGETMYEESLADLERKKTIKTGKRNQI